MGQDIETWRTTARNRTYVKSGGSRVKRLMRALVLPLILLGALVGAAAWLGSAAYSNRTYPQVVAGDVPVGSLTPQQAAQKLDQRVGGFLDSPVTLRLGEQTWAPSASAIGLDVDVSETVRRAASAGRDKNILSAVADTLLGRQRPVTVPFVLTIDRERLSGYLADIGESVDRQPVSPNVSVNGSSVSIVGGGPGYTFLQQETEARVLTALSTLSEDPVDVQVFTTQGSIPEAEVDRAQADASKIVGGPLTLEGGGQRWEVAQTRLRNWVRSEVRTGSGDAARLEISLDPVQLRTYLEGIGREIARPPENARLQWVNGQVQLARPSRSGRQLDVDRAIELIQAAALSDNRTVQLPLLNLPPSVSEASISSLGIKALIGTGESKFAGSPPERVANIRTAASSVTGYVVPAGETFSFRVAIGGVSEKRYKPELAGDGQRSIQGPLAGISQVSTTVFRAALRSGLPILERNPAPFRVSYYEAQSQNPGADAVVTLPGQDLQFDNNTAAAILVQVLVGEGEMRVELYGTSPGWTVSVAPPEIKNVVQPTGEVVWRDPQVTIAGRRPYLPAAPGAEVTVRRRVLKGAEVVNEDNFFSRYQPQPAVFVVGGG